MNFCLQPEYVEEFVCDGVACPSNCCRRNWQIEIDAATYEKYSRLEPQASAQALTNLFQRDDAKNIYRLKKRPCPLLTREGLCRLQLEHGEDFLSSVCKTYPRVIFRFGELYEQSLELSCPRAAELILFKTEPLRFELVKFTQAGRYARSELFVPQRFLAHVADIQIAMLSILQKRTLSIDGRLIVLGFFLDRLEELSAGELDAAALTRLLDAYESKKFLTEQMPRFLRAVTFDAERYATLLRKMFKALYGEEGVRFVDAQLKTPQVVARAKFLSSHATFLENYLVNELFMNCYPWRFKASLAINYGMFVAAYKVFELIIATVDGKAELIQTVGGFATREAHDGAFHKKIFKQLPGEVFGLMESLLDTKRAVL